MGNWSTIAQGLLTYLRKVPTENGGQGTYIHPPLPQELNSPSALNLYLHTAEHPPHDAIEHSGKRSIQSYAHR